MQRCAAAVLVSCAWLLHANPAIALHAPGSIRDSPLVFVRDAMLHVTRLVGAGWSPSLSGDGRFVAFQSEASDLVALEDINLLWDVFALDRATNAITRLSGDPGKAWMERAAATMP